MNNKQEANKLIFDKYLLFTFCNEMRNENSDHESVMMIMTPTTKLKHREK